MEAIIKECIGIDELYRKLENLKYLYLVNKICLKSIAEDLQNCLTFKREGGKILKELIVEEVENIKAMQLNLIQKQVNELKEFGNLSQILLENLSSDDSTPMSEVKKDDIQNSARELIRLINQILEGMQVTKCE